MSQMQTSHIQEWLSKAYIRAIAAHAGYNIQGFEQDYATDGTFRQVRKLEGDYVVFGPGLDFQAKSCINCIWDDKNGLLKYDMKVPAYNKLVKRNNEDSTPCILILCCLAKDKVNWVKQTEDELLLKRCCYWYYAKGNKSKNKDDSSQRIEIPRSQLFTPDSLSRLMELIKIGRWIDDK